MGHFEKSEISHIVKFTCSSCRTNTVYISAQNYQNNTEPFKANKYVCTECSQGMFRSD